MKPTTVALLAILAGVETATGQQVLQVDGKEIRILRDRFGVPHVFAADERTLFYGNGYAVAQDRLWQMERNRRDARGEMAEIDPKALARDRDVRKLGYTDAERQRRFDQLAATHRLQIQAYIDGVNAWMAEAAAAGRLPQGYAQNKIKPAPFRAIDSVAISDLMSQRFGSGGGAELRNLRYLNKLKQKFGAAASQQIFDDLMWQNDPASPTTILDNVSQQTSTSSSGASWIQPSPGFTASDASLARAESSADLTRIREYAERNGLFSRWGSYAWVVAPGRSASGNAVLVGGPQMGFSTPQIAHEVHLSGAGLNIIGMGFAGIPGVLIGHNDQLAWTTTSGLTDMEDVFVEKLNPSNKYQYWFQGKWHDMERHTETIQVRDSKPEVVEVCRTVHGPILEWDDSEPVAYSLKRAFREKELETMRAISGFWRARTLEEFSASAKLIWLTHNFFVATVQGDIGYWHCGRPPLRAEGVDPRLPTTGTGEKEWKGVLSPEQTPQWVNPKQGFICNWNNKPVGYWNNGERPVWGAIFRVHRITHLLEARRKRTFEQIRDITVDIGLNDPNADYLKPHLLKAISSAGMAKEQWRQVHELLDAWDNHAVEGSVAKTLFDEWLQSVREAIFADELRDVDRDLFNTITQPSLILHVLEGKTASVPVRYDFLNGKSVTQVQLEALQTALQNLSAKRGAVPALWGHVQPAINFKPLPPIPSTNRGTYIQVVELSKPVIRSVSILPPGQSEDPQSPHFSDQRELAGNWKFKPMLYTKELLELDAKQGK
ncbi:MAG: penicillin acylase family protein [Acidobacteria bacterium]|nr:penicillin acylase family protein [Acidobacteriota bacterium]MCI0626876.1 penicillin acylase family protein [Acidobacteriota bacterium]MCI0720237.1 penicillin acylase family protein [Acidobacteriota bacterium]